jgi:signal transduction histidine kinase
MSDRRDLERRLHDGLQQELVAIAVRVQLARGLVPGDPDHACRLLDEVRGDVTAAIDELRALASRLYPAFLASDGLVASLRAVGGDLTADGVGRLPLDLEEELYFTCRDALERGGSVRLVQGDGVVGVAIDGVTRTFPLEEPPLRDT